MPVGGRALTDAAHVTRPRTNLFSERIHIGQNAYYYEYGVPTDFMPPATLLDIRICVTRATALFPI